MKKKLIIWCSVSLVLLILVNFAVGSILLGFLNVIVPQYIKYGEKIGVVIYSSDDVIVDASDESNLSVPAALKMRAYFSDKMSNMFMYEDKLKDEGWVTYTYSFFAEKHEINKYSSGCWWNVYRYEPESLRDNDCAGNMELKTSFAILDMEKAILQGYGVELQDAIRNNEEICIKVDEYAVNGIELIPMHIVVIDGDTVVKEYTPNSSEEISDGFEYVKDDDTWLYNAKYQNLGEVITTIDISNTKEIERLRGIAQKTASNIEYREGIEDINNHRVIKKNIAMPGKETVIYYGVSADENSDDRYAFVMVASMPNWRPLIICSVVVIGAWSIVFGIVVFALKLIRRKKVSSNKNL